MDARGIDYADIARGIGIEDSQPIWALVKRDSRKSQFAGPLAQFFNVPLERLVAEDFDVSETDALREPAGQYGLTPIRTWEHETDLPPGDYAFIPRLDVRLSAGHGAEQKRLDLQIGLDLTSEKPQAFRADWIRKMKLRPSKLASLTVHGDSMENRLHEGDSVVIDTSQTDVVDGRVYALWYDGGERIKRLYRLPGGGLMIRSDNEAKYPPITLRVEDADSVRIIGRVVHVAGEGGL